MSDITKCGDKKCPSRETCWRYTAPSSPLQSYGDFNRAENDEQCQDYWPVSEPNDTEKRYRVERATMKLKHKPSFTSLEDRWGEDEAMKVFA